MDASSPLGRALADEDPAGRSTPATRFRKNGKKRGKRSSGPVRSPIARRHRALYIEALEDRVVLSHLVADLSGTTLSLTSRSDSNGSGDATVYLSTDANGTLEYEFDDSNPSPDFVNLSGGTFTVDMTKISQIDVDEVGPQGEGVFPTGLPISLELGVFSTGTGGLILNTVDDLTLDGVLNSNGGAFVVTTGTSFVLDSNGSVSTQGGAFKLTSGSTGLFESSVNTEGGAVTVTSSAPVSIDSSVTTLGGDVSVTANDSTINVGDTATAGIDTSNPTTP